MEDCHVSIFCDILFQNPKIPNFGQSLRKNVWMCVCVYVGMRACARASVGPLSANAVIHVLISGSRMFANTTEGPYIFHNWRRL